MVFGALALVRPGALAAMTGDMGPGGAFYARMYAARALLFGLVVAILPFTPAGASAAWVVIAAGLVQFADSLIGFRSGERRMAVSAAIAGVVHVVCGIVFLVA